MIERLWNKWQPRKAFKALQCWNGYYQLEFQEQMAIRQALDVLRKASEK
jgi:hypothetical protein